MWGASPMPPGWTQPTIQPSYLMIRMLLQGLARSVYPPTEVVHASAPASARAPADRTTLPEGRP
jgi:hypothetical protein